MIRELTAMQPADGFDRVYFPGEPEGIRREQRLQEGIPIERGLCQELTQLGDRFSIPFPAPR